MLIDYCRTDTAVKSTFAKVFKVKYEMVPLLGYMLRDARLDAFELGNNNSTFERPFWTTTNPLSPVKEGQLLINCINGDRLVIP